MKALLLIIPLVAAIAAYFYLAGRSRAPTAYDTMVEVMDEANKRTAELVRDRAKKIAEQNRNMNDALQKLLSPGDIRNMNEALKKQINLTG